MAKSGYQRVKEWRDRASSGEQLPTCKMCDRPIKGKLSIARGVCSYCFLGYPGSDNELSIGMSDLEELDPQVLSMLFQSLKMDAPEFGLAYS